jgi:glycosyltransferase involved in cell wall biosynthesis
MAGSLVSVIIPTYNNAKLIPYTLESILGQSYSPLEIIVVNDGSTDETAEVVQGYISRAAVRLHTQPNQGDISARNKGIELARGEYIAFIDSDDLWNREHVRLLVEEIERSPETGMAFDNVIYFAGPEASERQGEVAAADGGEKIMVDPPRAKRMAAAPVSLQEIYTDNLITTSAFMVRKEVFARVGVFDKEIYLMNDLHLFYRIGAYYTMRFVDYVGVRKRIHPKSLSMVNSHYEYGVYCLENIRERYPEVYQRIGRRVFNQKLGSKYYRLGRHYERRGDREKAKDMYRKALLTRRLNLRYYWEYARASWS